MTTTHTPAPWKIGPNDRSDGLSVIATTPRGTAIAVCYGTGRLDNARLISAAPDMFEFIRRLSQMTTPEDEFAEDPQAYDDADDMVNDMGSDRLMDEYMVFMEFVREARAAIAKARGDA
jgi:hypothetical protein